MSTAARFAVCGLIAVIVTPGVLDAQSLTAPDSLPPGVTFSMVERGEEVFNGSGMCAACHGPLADGLIGPDLTDPEWWHAEGSYLAIVRRVLTGVPLTESTSR